MCKEAFLRTRPSEQVKQAERPRTQNDSNWQFEGPICIT